MSKAQLVITAVVLEGRSKSEVARDYGVSWFWVRQLVDRYLAEGAAAFEPRSRRPHDLVFGFGADRMPMVMRAQTGPQTGLHRQTTLTIRPMHKLLAV